MNRITLLTSAFLGVLVFSSQSLAQCVQCLPGIQNPDVFTCQAAERGGNECVPQGTICAVSGTCHPNPDRPSGFSRQDSKLCSQERIGSVKINSDFISQISEKHSRFAIALAWLNENGLLGQKNVRISLLPVRLDKDTYDKWLNRITHRPTLEEAANGALFNRQNELPRPVKGSVTVIYSVTITENVASGVATIQLEVIQGFADDPTFSTLEITVEQIPSANATEKQWQVRNWEIR